jgi:hypothetical protein
MIKKLLMIAVALGVIGAAAAGTLYYIYPVQVLIFAGLTRGHLRHFEHARATCAVHLKADIRLQRNI